MGTEHLAGATILAVLGLGLIVTGALGRRRSIDDALGGWSTDTVTPDSWERAHRTAGSAFTIAGSLAFAGATLALIGTDSATGPVVVPTAVALLVPVVVGVVRGTNQLERS